MLINDYYRIFYFIESKYLIFWLDTLIYDLANFSSFLSKIKLIYEIQLVNEGVLVFILLNMSKSFINLNY